MFYTHLPKRTQGNLSNLYKSEEEIGREAIEKAEQADIIIKGRKGEPIGTKKTWGGIEYVKTAQGWSASKKVKAAHEAIHGKPEQTHPAPKGMSKHAVAAYNDVASGISSEDFHKKHKVGDYDSYKESATKNGNKKFHVAEEKNEAGEHAQTDSFEHNGHTVQRHHLSHTQGTYTVHKDGKQIGGGHYSQEMYHSKPDGRANQFKKTDKEIKGEVDKIAENHAKKEKVMEHLKHTTFSEGLKKDMADYFVSPAFPELKDLSEFKGSNPKETKENFEKLNAFKSGKYTYLQAQAMADAMHKDDKPKELTPDEHGAEAAKHFDQAQKEYFRGNHDKANEHHEKGHEHLMHALGKQKDKFNAVYNNPEVKHVTVGGGHKPLSSQLQAETGDHYNAQDFDGDANTGSVITHKKTGQKYTVINHKQADLVKHYQDKNK